MNILCFTETLLPVTVCLAAVEPAEWPRLEILEWQEISTSKQELESWESCCSTEAGLTTLGKLCTFFLLHIGPVIIARVAGPCSQSSGCRQKLSWRAFSHPRQTPGDSMSPAVLPSLCPEAGPISSPPHMTAGDSTHDGSCLFLPPLTQVFWGPALGDLLTGVYALPWTYQPGGSRLHCHREQDGPS
jgi:hypothetical protein